MSERTTKNIVHSVLLLTSQIRHSKHGMTVFPLYSIYGAKIQKAYRAAK